MDRAQCFSLIGVRIKPVFYIAKKNEYSELCVTSIKRGGLTLNNVRLLLDPNGEIAGHKYWQVRKFSTLKTAESALQKLHTVGGFDDYQICFRGDL